MSTGKDFIGRREFFGAAFNEIGNLAMTAIKAAVPNKQLIRPPGAVEEIAFLAGCQRCGKCSLVCEESAIHIAGLNQGVLVGTPYLNPSEQPCTFCQKCIDVCPSGVLESQSSLESYAIGVAEINQDICLAYNNQLCSSCHYSCPQGIKAIELKDFRYPVIRTEHCIGCGQCAKACIAERSAIKVLKHF